MRRLTSICVLITLFLAIGTPVQADGDGDGGDGDHGRGDVFSVTPYDDDYAFTDEECGFDVKGHAKGVDTIYNVRGSDGQAFLDDNRFTFKETWTSASGGTATASGKARFRETEARHVDGVTSGSSPRSSRAGRSQSGTPRGTWSWPSTGTWSSRRSSTLSATVSPVVS